MERFFEMAVLCAVNDRSMTGRPPKEVSWRSIPDVSDASPCEFYFVRLSRHGRENRENSMTCRNRDRLQAHYGIGTELCFHFASHARSKRLCRFLVRRAPCVKAANFFRHSQAYKVIERDAVLARQKLRLSSQ